MCFAASLSSALNSSSHGRGNPDSSISTIAHTSFSSWMRSTTRCRNLTEYHFTVFLAIDAPHLNEKCRTSA